jgi:hypothetical protein
MGFGAVRVRTRRRGSIVGGSAGIIGHGTLTSCSQRVGGPGTVALGAIGSLFVPCPFC